VKEEGWGMINDPKQLEDICKKIISTNPKLV
jgi:Asp-tRNA(Asn)/Glu-tRNA(Gln) amidotransferase B subunit